MSPPLEVLRRIATTRASTAVEERCDMCGRDAGGAHSHVVDVGNRSLLCTCRPCYLLFTHDDAQLRYRSVPERYLSFPDFAISAGQWDDLAIPVSVAFFFTHSSLARTAAFYPSPAGATESELPLAAWAEIVSANPALATLADDVEAVLLRKEGDTFSCFLLPIDQCYELVGELRRRWRGFDGGQEVHRWLADFFRDVAARCSPAPGGRP